MTPTQLVIDSLREKLATSPLTGFDTAFPRAPLAAELYDRIKQLGANMVDGRVLPAPEAAALQAAVIELVRSELLPRVEANSPAQSVALLDFLARLGVRTLEGERPRLLAAKRARFPRPAPLATPEIESLRALATTQPTACVMAAPIPDAAFANVLEADGLPLPEELIALYAACDGFDLTFAEYLPVFSLLPSTAIDVSDADDYPRRVVPFAGGDSVQLAVYRDPSAGWRLVYEYEFNPLADVAFDLPRLLRFALRRATAVASAEDALFDGELSWDTFFRVA